MVHLASGGGHGCATVLAGVLIARKYLRSEIGHTWAGLISGLVRLLQQAYSQIIQTHCSISDYEFILVHASA
jgi:hypothetical protein